MDPYQEKIYLTDLLLEASRWKVSEGESLNGLELEVRDRLRRLLGIETQDGNGYVQSDIPEYVAKEVSRRKDNRSTIRIRCSDGKYHRVHIDKLCQVPSRRSKTGFEWRLKEGEKDGYEQCRETESV